MVYSTIEEIHGAMQKQQNIRNITICAHVDNGKTTTTDSLLNKAGIISDEHTGNRLKTDTRPDEQERNITIKSTGISLYYELPEDISLPVGAEGNKFLINLIDSPGHVDFSSEVTAALRVTDGCIIILDAIKGVCVQTETVMRQALDEMVKPVALINKIDRLILELKLAPEEIYQKFYNHIVSCNALLAKYNNKMSEIQVSPEDGTVCFGCGIMGWGFNLGVFARKWAPKMNCSPDELVKKLWGENYWHPREKKWYTTKVSGSHRGFTFFCLNPIMQVVNTILEEDGEKVARMLDSMNIKLGDKEKDLIGKKLLKPVMQKFLPNADGILEMIIKNLPSPVQAQSYRVDHLYTGPKDDVFYNAIKNCDPNGPLVMYISKLFPAPDMSRFYAFGRVFSGKVKPTMINIQGPEYTPETKTDVFKGRRIQNVCVMMADKAESIEFAPAGNTAALSGIDGFILKTATITENLDCHIIRDMKFTVSPVVSVAVACKKPQDLPKLMNGLKLLTKSDPLCQTRFDKDTGEIVISGAGELHLEICVHDLQTMFARGVELSVSDPVVPFRETIIGTSSELCLAKSPNKHNRLFLTAEPIDPELVKALEARRITKSTEVKERIRLLGEYGWDKDTASKIWGIDEINNVNMLVDLTKGVQYLNEIKDSLLAGFNSNAVSGPLCGEPLIGVRFNIHDVVLHADAIHRGGGQMIPTMQRVMNGSVLTAGVRLLEPIYQVDIQCPTELVSAVYSVLNQRRGSVIEETTDENSGATNIVGHLPVAESIGFTQYLRSQTQGKAFPQCSFSHWEIINEDPLVFGTKANKIVQEVRKRKGMEVEIPPLNRFIDKL